MLKPEFAEAKAAEFTSSTELQADSSGLFFILSKPAHGITHLTLGMEIDYEYHAVTKELFPLVFQRQDVQQLLENFNTSIK